MSDTLQSQTSAQTANSTSATPDVTAQVLEAKDIASHLGNIQGNIVGGFNKDYQAFLLLKFTNAYAARSWLASIIDEVATSSDVLAYNRVFKQITAYHHGQEGTVKATWMNIAFTFHGLQALGVAADELNSFPDDFKQGMKQRHDVAIFPGLTLGDVGANDSAHWIEPFKSTTVDAVMLLASDAPEDLDHEVAHQTQKFNQGVHLLFKQLGKTREKDQRGHEHFGFKDGISQPAILGVDQPDDPMNPEQGHPGQDLIQPGEFVLGYHKQPGKQGANNDVPDPGPDWIRDGSYLVFRRLRQNVKGFREFVTSQAVKEGITPDVMGAKLVGRYESGAPLERTKDEPANFDPTLKDPSIADPSLLDDSHINNFEYAADADGKFVPRSAHIRKVYPRDELVPGGGFDPAQSEPDTQTHRLLRRGIPYGESFQENAPAGSPAAADADRGLLFLAYQHSISEQFEFVQGVWVNNPNFPGRPDGSGGDDGQDPIIAQKSPLREFDMPGARQQHITMMQQWVTTTGGDYFLQPSISALRHLAK
jgi:Dyp-type peroxidase family